MCSDNNDNTTREDLLIREYGWVTKVVTKAWDDENFAEELAQDPKNALHKVFPNVPFDLDNININVVFDDENNLTLVVPYLPSLKERGY